MAGSVILFTTSTVIPAVPKGLFSYRDLWDIWSDLQ